MASPEPRRCLVVWFPDWPVTAWRRAKASAARSAASGPDAAGDSDGIGAVAVLAAGRVLACSAAAHADGVAEGMRRREAQARCPGLVVVPADPGRDDRLFATLLDRLEQIAPGFQVVRPGLCAVPVRGVARYYGGELPAAKVMLDVLAGIGIHDARVGVADGMFTAEQAARLAEASGRVEVIPPGEAAAFLAPLPVTVLGDEALSALLRRLGVRTLGSFAALEAESVRERFGPHGARMHALAGGRDSRPLIRGCRHPSWSVR